MILGIDVSDAQGVIDWQQVARATVERERIGFAWLQAAFKDEMCQTFLANVRAARAAGILVGAYCFAYDSVQPETAGSAFLEAIARAGGAKMFALPPALDYEQTDLTDKVQGRWASGWVDKVQRAAHWRGGRPIIYSDPGWWNPLAPELAFKVGPAWIADLSKSGPTQLVNLPEWRMWQWEWAGKVPGIAGPVDLNWFRGTIEELTSGSWATAEAVVASA